MDGLSLGSGTAFLPPVSPSWIIRDLGDYDGDGNEDILWREAASGATYLWLMNGASPLGAGFTSSQADVSWTIQTR